MSRVKSSPAQLARLSEHMRNHPNMASGVADSLQGRADLERQWIDLANILNSLGGPIKTVPKWKQAWRDLRNNVKKKVAHNQREMTQGSAGNGLPSLKQLSEIEEQVLSLTGPMAIDGVDETEEHESASSGSVNQSESLLLQDEAAAGFAGEGAEREALDSLPAASLTNTKSNDNIGASIKNETVSSSEESPPAGSGGGDGAPRTSKRRRPSPPPQRPKRTTAGRNSLPPPAARAASEAARRRLRRRSPPPQTSRVSDTASLTERLIAIEERRVDAEHAIARSQEMFARGHLKMAEALNKLTNTLDIFTQQLFESHRQHSSFNGG